MHVRSCMQLMHVRSCMQPPHIAPTRAPRQACLRCAQQQAGAGVRLQQLQRALHKRHRIARACKQWGWRYSCKVQGLVRKGGGFHGSTGAQQRPSQSHPAVHNILRRHSMPWPTRRPEEGVGEGAPRAAHHRRHRLPLLLVQPLAPPLVHRRRARRHRVRSGLKRPQAASLLLRHCPLGSAGAGAGASGSPGGSQQASSRSCCSAAAPSVACRRASAERSKVKRTCTRPSNSAVAGSGEAGPDSCGTCRAPQGDHARRGEGMEHVRMRNAKRGANRRQRKRNASPNPPVHPTIPHAHPPAEPLRSPARTPTAAAGRRSSPRPRPQRTPPRRWGGAPGAGRLCGWERDERKGERGGISSAFS